MTRMDDFDLDRLAGQVTQLRARVAELEASCSRKGAEICVLSEDNEMLKKAVERNYSIKNLEIKTLRAEVERLKDEALGCKHWSLHKEENIALRARIAELEHKLATVAEIGCRNCAPTRARMKELERALQVIIDMTNCYSEDEHITEVARAALNSSQESK